MLTPIAVQGHDAPAGGRYVLFGDSAIDSLRRVTFSASLSRGQNGIFRTRRGGFETLVLSGDPAPADAGNRFAGLFEVCSNARDDLAFVANTFFPARGALFMMTDGVVRTIVRAGDPSPTGKGDIITGFNQLRLLDSGDLYFSVFLLDTEGLERSAVLRYRDGSIVPMVAPGDRYMGTRAIYRTYQYDVTPGGEITVEASVTNSDLHATAGPVGEIVQLAAGRLHSLASVGLSVSGGIDLFRNFAVTFDQVHTDEAGRAGFYAGTNDHPDGAYLTNESGRLYDNVILLAQGDPAPASPTDRLDSLGAFDMNTAGTTVFYAATIEHPAGALFVLRAGHERKIAAAGEPRPDGADVWRGFLRIDLGEDPDDSFVFTDFAAIAQVGVYLGRFVPPADVALARLEAALAMAGLPALARPLSLALGRGQDRLALTLAQALVVQVDARAGRSLDSMSADRISLELEDLIAALGGPSGPGPVPAPRSRTGGIRRDTPFDRDPGRH